jgi:hypothetical protein
MRKAMWKPWKKKQKKQKRRRKLPTLKGRSKIKCLLSLGKTKEVSQQMLKVDTKKKI